MRTWCLTVLVAFLLGTAVAQWDENAFHEDLPIVHLFEWKWEDIANECETWLSVKGFGGVQVSPPSENAVIMSPERPWWERYQPVSYRLVTRSGDETQFVDMVKRCNEVGVRIYVDLVFNHMTGNNSAIGTGFGTGDCSYDYGNLHYPCVPYSKKDFHAPFCLVDDNLSDASNERNCYLVGLADLDQSSDKVRSEIEVYMNRLVAYGVAGFRIDAALNMDPTDLQVIYNSVNNLDSQYFTNLRPFLYQSVEEIEEDPISKDEYTPLGRVVEFLYSVYIGETFKNVDGRNLSQLYDFGLDYDKWGMVPSDVALVFVDNHDNQKGGGIGGDDILTFKDGRTYRTANGFMLAWPYGVVKIMSSYYFTDENQGPPHDENYNTMSPIIGTNQQCVQDRLSHWICEHRWTQITNMVTFRRSVSGTEMTNWWDNNGDMIAFSREDQGFIAINNSEDEELHEALQTGLAPGDYCDIVSGHLIDMQCTGRKLLVNLTGWAQVDILPEYNDGFIAIHPMSKVPV